MKKDSEVVKSLDDFFYFEYLSLLKEKKEVEEKINTLKEKCLKEAANKERFFLTYKKYSFKAENIKNLPVELLIPDTKELTKIYNSAIGGESFLAKYGLKIKVKETAVFKPRKDVNEK